MLHTCKRGQKSKTLTTPNVGEDLEQQELFSLLLGKQIGTAILEGMLFGSFL